MNTEFRTRLMSSVIFITLISSAVFTVPARADSGSPPPPPAPSGSSSTSTTKTANASQVPAVTNLTGGNNTGHKVGLGNQQAAYIAQPGDPIWCPATVAVPVAGAGGCSPSADNTDLYTLTHDVQSGLGVWAPQLKNSNIWIEGGPDGSVNQIVLNGSTLPLGIATLNTFTLTFKGGWTGVGGTINPANPSTFNGVGFSIGSWHNNVTLSNLVINNSPSGQDGLYVYSTKNISLTNVIAAGEYEYGAYLDNTSGTGVTVTNSAFLNNDLHLNASMGIWVQSAGPITVTNLNASGNDYNGAYLNNSIASSPQNLTLNGTNIFDDNQLGGYGLYALSKGAIASGTIEASRNDIFGALFDNTSAATALPVTLTGNSTFNENGGDGLDVRSQGAITTNNLFADANTKAGVWLKNNNLFTSAVNVTGTNLLTKNGQEGLKIDSLGDITLNNITANGNGPSGGHSGLLAENSVASAAQSITLTGANIFNQNSLNGATLLASGKVSISNVTATANLTGSGLLLENYFLGSTKPQSVSLSGTNNLANNNVDNLDIATYGAITINNLTDNNSLTGYGANLFFGSITPSGNVTLTGINTFDNNGGTGLNINSSGTVVLNGTSAISNTNAGVAIDNTASTTVSPVTVNGLSTFSYNGLDGLLIFSKGAILTNGLTVESNIGNGAEVINTFATTSVPVTLNGINTFNKNCGGGLDVQSNGTIIASNLSALNNGIIGVSIENQSSTTFAPVTLIGLGNFSYNNFGGLKIESKGAVLSNGLTAVNNGGGGVSIQNFTSSTAHAVTLNGVNTFNNNTMFGLSIASTGTVIANSISALTNTSTGVEILNNTLLTAYPVTLKGLTTVNYNGQGLYINSYGAVLTGGLMAVGNSGGNGATIYNNFGSSTNPVTMNGTNTFNKNSGNGLTVNSYGAIVVNNLTAIGNNSNGADIENGSSSIPASVTLIGLGTFNSNLALGLNLLSKGTVITNGLIAVSNTSTGVNIFNNLSAASQAVTLNGTNTFKNNVGGGLTIFSKGAVTGNSLNAVNNSGTGLTIFNDSSTTGSPVTLNGLTTANYNGSGFTITSNGPVLTNGLMVVSNNGSGATINNNSGSFSPSVTLKAVNTFNANGAGGGLTINSYGTILTNSLNANNNAGYGADISNSSSTTNASVTLTGLNTFNSNGSAGGLIINSTGAVLTGGLIANSNSSGGGVNISNSFLGSTSPVTLNGVNTFTNNSGNGLTIASNGMVKTLNLTGLNNTSDGVLINNNSSTTVAPVTLSGMNTFNNNGSSGLVVISLNTITTNNLTANNNGATGVTLQNNMTGTGKINVLGKNVTFDNVSDGLYLLSNAAVSLTNVSAKMNGIDGMFVDTTGNVSVNCGSFIGNGTSHGITGYGWETGIDVPLITLTGVTSLGNFTGDTKTDNLGTTVTHISKTCVLP